VRLSRPLPYPAAHVRSVTLVADGGRLALDITAEVAVEPAAGAGGLAGADLGIIHPFALAAGGACLLVSGRAVRAEERLHLADTKARARVMARKTPSGKGQRGSRRWRKLRAAQRRAEARHLRRVRQVHHHAVKEVIAWAQARQVGTIVAGDLRGITRHKTGRHHNRRVANTWRRTHLLSALSDKAEVAGIQVVVADERGTSSTCPECRSRTAKPRGRVFACPQCGYEGHRDLVGARNIAARGGGITTARAVVTHRRAGIVPARRDRRRHLMDLRRSCLAPGRPHPGGVARRNRGRTSEPGPAPQRATGEDQPTRKR
jgi:IS605 OrfB family transposase